MSLSPGKLARRVLGDRVFQIVSVYYRRVFVDLDEVARSLERYVPQDAHIVDVGGGDGAALEALLAMRPDLTATMIDLSPAIGAALGTSSRARVSMRPATSIRQYLDANGPAPGVVLLSDVVHHVPVQARGGFFDDLRELLARGANVPLIVKDVEPVGLRSKLAYLADRYITGDANVVFLPRREMIAFVRDRCGAELTAEAPLYERDAPNYALVFAG